MAGFELFQLAKDPQHLYVAAEARSKRERQERGILSPQRGSVHVQNLPGELFPEQALGFPISGHLIPTVKYYDLKLVKFPYKRPHERGTNLNLSGPFEWVMHRVKPLVAVPPQWRKGLSKPPLAPLPRAGFGPEVSIGLWTLTH